MYGKNLIPLFVSECSWDISGSSSSLRLGDGDGDGHGDAETRRSRDGRRSCCSLLGVEHAHDLVRWSVVVSSDELLTGKV